MWNRTKPNTNARGEEKASTNGHAASTKPNEWFDRASMAAIFGMRASSFDKGPRRFATDEDIRREGRRVMFHAPSIIRRWAEATYGPTIGDEEEAGLFRDTDSPALERWREAKAKHAELDYRERVNELVPRDQIRAGLLEIASRLRQFGESLQRHYGNPAIDLLHEALADIEEAIERMFPGDDEDGDDENT